MSFRGIAYSLYILLKNCSEDKELNHKLDFKQKTRILGFNENTKKTIEYDIKKLLKDLFDSKENLSVIMGKVTYSILRYFQWVDWYEVNIIPKYTYICRICGDSYTTESKGSTDCGCIDCY